MYDYGVDWPLWNDEDGLTVPEDWPMLSPALTEDLKAWADHAEKNLSYGRTSEDDRRWHLEEGERLRNALAMELGPDYKVVLRPWVRIARPRR